MVHTTGNAQSHPEQLEPPPRTPSGTRDRPMEGAACVMANTEGQTGCHAGSVVRPPLSIVFTDGKAA